VGDVERTHGDEVVALIEELMAGSTSERHSVP